MHLEAPEQAIADDVYKVYPSLRVISLKRRVGQTMFVSRWSQWSLANRGKYTPTSLVRPTPRQCLSGFPVRRSTNWRKKHGDHFRRSFR